MSAEPAPLPRNPARRRRRPSGQAREELIAAARKSFIELGYHGASLRQIAARADTTQAMLYRNFASKAELFEQSVLRPFEEFVAELVRNWRAASVSDLPTPELMAGFTEALYDFTRTHRGMLLTLVAADAHDDTLGDVRTSFTETIGSVVDQVLADREARGWTDIDLEVATPATMALIISVALLDDWLFPESADRPGRDRILAELTRYEVRAVTGENP